MGDAVYAYCNICERGDTVAHPLRQLLPMAWLCDECGRAWQAAAFRTSVRWEVRADSAIAEPSVHFSSHDAHRVRNRWAGGTVVKVTTRRRKRP